MSDQTNELLKLTIPQLLRWRKNKDGKKTALREKEFGIWNIYSWNRYYDMVRKTALGLQQLGLKKGDKLALIGDNIPEMLIVAIATQSIGAISAAIYQSSLSEEIAPVLDYMDISMVFCEDQEQVDKLVTVKDKIPKVKKVIYEDSRGMFTYQKDDWFIYINEIWHSGDTIHQQIPDKFEALIDQGKPDDICHFCLTSGTTGLPKASMITHRNYINMGLQLTKVDPLTEDDEYLSFLPFAWIGEQMNSFGVALAVGLTINFPESVDTAMHDLQELGPHFMFGAPRIYENLQSQIWLKINESYWLNRICYNYFIKVGEKAALFRMGGKKLPIWLALKNWIGTQMIFRPLINQMGLLRLKRAYTGGAALGPELFTFYQALGVNLKQIYGQTEIIGIAYMHRDGDVRHDTVGQPLPETECKITDEGEIISKSPSVCLGYYKLPEKTAELLKDGWLYSGDAGYIDENDHLVIIDRLSDVMHNSKDEMFSPMFLENKLKFSPYIKEAVIFGNKKDYVSSLVNVDPITVGKWAEDHGISFTTYMDLSQKTEVRELITAEIIRVNQNVEKEHFKIKRFALLYKLLDADEEELTKTGKLRRKLINQKYDELIQALYDTSIVEKDVKAKFRYQDGQTTEVDAHITFVNLQ